MKTIQPNWPLPKLVHAFTTTRHGGVSQAPYTSLNLAMHVADDPDAVKTNRQRLLEQGKLPVAPIWLEQVHSTTVLNLDHLMTLPNTPPQADAVYTSQPNQVCAVMTADCLPVLLCAPQTMEVAAVHAGWRGLCHGILEQTLTHFTAPPDTIYAWLGPAIGPQQFEVGAEVRTQFMAQQPQAEQAFRLIDNTQQKYLADIYQLARQRLNHVGVKHISGGEYCTVSQADDFYSYRRETTTGRMATLIWIDG